MAARFWGLFLVGNVVAAAGVTVVVAHAMSLSTPAALSVTLAALIGLPALLVTASFIQAAVADGSGGAGHRRLGPTLRALCAECLYFDRAVLAMVTAPYAHDPEIDTPVGRARPVLLIHGILCNRGVWRPWFAPLRARGFGPVRAVKLEPLLGDIEAHAEAVAQELRDLQRSCQGARVTIIAHSMGGLVARAALRRVGAAVVREIVAIASPHHGTTMARPFPWPAARQMRPDSPWLHALDTAAAASDGVTIISMYSPQDNLIVPARSAILEGAHVLEFAGMGHLGLLGRRRCIDAAISALAPAAPA